MLVAKEFVWVKQADCECHKMLTSTLVKEMEFQQSAVDQSVYFRRSEEEHMIIACGSIQTRCCICCEYIVAVYPKSRSSALGGTKESHFVPWEHERPLVDLWWVQVDLG